MQPYAHANPVADPESDCEPGRDADAVHDSDVYRDVFIECQPVRKLQPDADSKRIWFLIPVSICLSARDRLQHTVAFRISHCVAVDVSIPDGVAYDLHVNDSITDP